MQGNQQRSGQSSKLRLDDWPVFVCTGVALATKDIKLSIMTERIICQREQALQSAYHVALTPPMLITLLATQWLPISRGLLVG